MANGTHPRDTPVFASTGPVGDVNASGLAGAVADFALGQDLSVTFADRVRGAVHDAVEDVAGSVGSTGGEHLRVVADLQDTDLQVVITGGADLDRQGCVEVWLRFVAGP